MFEQFCFPDEGLICFTGGGGKTTLMLRLARFLQRRGSVVVTSTVKMSESEIDPSETLVGDVSPSAIKNKIEERKRVFLFQELKNNKYWGFEPGVVASFYRRKLASYVLVEADGSRQLPLKGYAEHEPPLPSLCDYQMIVVGLDALLQPMNESTVARFDILRKFLDVKDRDFLTPPLLIKLLTSPEMYLKNSPSGARCFLCLNKADLMDPEILANWVGVLRVGLQGYCGIAVTSRSGGCFYPANGQNIFKR